MKSLSVQNCSVCDVSTRDVKLSFVCPKLRLLRCVVDLSYDVMSRCCTACCTTCCPSNRSGGAWAYVCCLHRLISCLRCQTSASARAWTWSPIIVNLCVNDALVNDWKLGHDCWELNESQQSWPSFQLWRHRIVLAPSQGQHWQPIRDPSNSPLLPSMHCVG